MSVDWKVHCLWKVIPCLCEQFCHWLFEHSLVSLWQRYARPITTYYLTFCSWVVLAVVAWIVRYMVTSGGDFAVFSHLGQLPLTMQKYILNFADLLENSFNLWIVIASLLPPLLTFALQHQPHPTIPASAETNEISETSGMKDTRHIMISHVVCSWNGATSAANWFASTQP